MEVLDRASTVVVMAVVDTEAGAGEDLVVAAPKLNVCRCVFVA